MWDRPPIDLTQVKVVKLGIGNRSFIIEMMGMRK
jgi:hypothetical protein